ncbi:cytochrome c [Ferrovum sp.]|uniref:c-type cytochrome n=1 Tax=Ferrovum sp. TaxID=2609467 RepID=UPI00260A99C1|nr:cytochrome c [Ferrovum sp.]
MKSLTRWIPLLALVPSLAMAWPWSMDMANQISVKPQEGPDAVRPFPVNSVPMTGTPTTPYVHDAETAMNLPNPNPPTAKSVAYGREMFKIYCVPCHGDSGTGDGLVGEKLIVRPFDLTAPRVQKEVPEGYIWGHITFGGALMPSYGNDMSPSERWDVVNYVRHGLLTDPTAKKRDMTTTDNK